MIIVMESRATDEDVKHVLDAIKETGLQPHVSRGVERGAGPWWLCSPLNTEIPTPTIDSAFVSPSVTADLRASPSVIPLRTLPIP